MNELAARTFNELSICSGYGGLGMGLGIAVPGARGVCYVEREAASVEILAARMQDGSLDSAPIWSDLCTFDGKPWRGVVDIISAGIPCQPWSHAGKQEGFDDERHLGEELVRVVREVEPRFVFVENVAGFVRLGAPDLLGRLSEVGFDAEWGLFSAAGVGATHRRQRFFLLAYRNSGGLEGERVSSVLDGIGTPCGRDADRCGENVDDPEGGPIRVDVDDQRKGPRNEYKPGLTGPERDEGVVVPSSLRRGEGRSEYELRSGGDSASSAGCELGNAKSERLPEPRTPREGGAGPPHAGCRAPFPPRTYRRLERNPRRVPACD